jgi:hypothetical protein
MIIAAIIIVVGVMFWNKGGYLLENGKKAGATIIDSVFEQSRDGGGVHYPVVRFLTDKQEWITKQLDVGYSPAKKTGTKVEVIYDPEEPTNVAINSVFMLAILPRLFVCFGIVGFVLGILFYLGVVDRDYFIPN